MLASHSTMRGHDEWMNAGVRLIFNKDLFRIDHLVINRFVSRRVAAGPSFIVQMRSCC